MIYFTLYGRPHEQISFDDLLALQKEHGMLWAHAEDSGCESCYCEVAQWNEKTKRWERICFEKCQDCRLPELPNATDEETAEELAQQINKPLGLFRPPVISRMPDFKEVK